MLIPRTVLDDLVRHTRSMENRIGQVRSAVDHGYSANVPAEQLAVLAGAVTSFVREELVRRMYTSTDSDK